MESTCQLPSNIQEFNFGFIDWTFNQVFWKNGMFDPKTQSRINYFFNNPKISISGL